MKKFKLGRMQRIRIAFWLYLLSFAGNVLAGFLLGVEMIYIPIALLGVVISLFCFAFSLLLGFVTLGDLFKKEFLKTSSYLYSFASAFQGGIFLGALDLTSAERTFILLLSVFPLIAAVNLFGMVFSIALLSLRKRFKRLSYLACISGLLCYSTYMLLPFKQSFFPELLFGIYLFHYSTGFLVFISILLILHRSKRFLKEKSR
jgi:hypothetical protein